MARKKRPSQAGKTYIEKLSKIPPDDKRVNTTLFLPKTIGITEIENILEDYRKRNDVKIKLLPEYGALVFDLIIKRNFTLNQYYRKKKNIYDQYELNIKMKLAQGYAPISAKQFEFWVIKDHYRHYQEAFIQAGVIKNDDIYLNFEKNAKTYFWQILPKYYNRGEKEPYQKYKVQHPKVKYLLYERKLKKYKEAKAKADEIGRGFLDESANNALADMDMEMIIDYFTENEFEYYELDKPEYDLKEKKRRLKVIREKQNEDPPKGRLPVKDYVERLLIPAQEDYKAINRVKDGYHRLHSFATNMPKVIRKFIPLNGSYDNIETDFTNSQMMFMAQIANHPEEVKKILDDETLNSTIDLVLRFRKDDLDLFIEHSLDGSIYEFVERQMGIENRGKAKDRMFQIIFSDPKSTIDDFNAKKGVPSTYRDKIKDINDLFPSLFRICVNANADQKKGIPELLQRLEAKIVLDIIAPKMYKVGFGDFITIHDSFQYNTKFKNKAIRIIEKSFKELGLDKPQFKHRLLNK